MSFPGYTLVDALDGFSRAIDLLQVGDVVRTLSGWGKVKRISKRHLLPEEGLLALSFDVVPSMTMTLVQPLRVGDGWMAASLLQVGQRLAGCTELKTELTLVARKNIVWHGEVFSLQVEPDNSYIVGWLAALGAAGGIV